MPQRTAEDRSLPLDTATERRSGTGRGRPAAVAWMAAIVVALVAVAVPVLWGLTQTGAHADVRMPESPAIEQALGIRFSRVAVVGDGGLITVSYVVLDAEKALRFQSDREHAPVLVSEARDVSTRRVSLMKQGHNMRAGQTYYLVYENTGGALRPDEQMSIEVVGLRLNHVPVL
ncbi:MAG TPA: hypothetical protein VGK35_09745 [Actinotalea sp.]|jgi:hypothetical protein